jgi:hypothetical protein
VRAEKTAKEKDAMKDMQTIRLREGSMWVELEPTADAKARVVAGNVHQVGDVLARPTGLSWSEAAETVDGGGTRFSPFDLELVADSVTGFEYTPQANEDSLDTLAAVAVTTSPDDPAAWLLAQAGSHDELVEGLGRAEVAGEAKKDAGGAVPRRDAA